MAIKFSDNPNAGTGQRQSRLSAIQEGIEIISQQVTELENLADNLVGMTPTSANVLNQEQPQENNMAVMIENFPVVARSLAERISSVESRLRNAFI